MEENKKTLELMEKIEENSRRQLRTNRILCAFTGVAMVCCLVMLMTVLRLVPQVSQVMAGMQSVLSNLEETTSQLTKIDLGSMVENVETLVATGQESLEQTMDKLNNLDLDTLNAAINALGTVVEKLQKVLKFLG